MKSSKFYYLIIIILIIIQLKYFGRDCFSLLNFLFNLNWTNTFDKYFKYFRLTIIHMKSYGENTRIWINYSGKKIIYFLVWTDFILNDQWNTFIIYFKIILTFFRKMNGNDLEGESLENLKELEDKLEIGRSRVRSRRVNKITHWHK